MKKRLLIALLSVSCLNLAACSPAVTPATDDSASAATTDSALPPVTSSADPASASATQPAAIPAAFLGQWDVPPDPCNPHSDGRMTVNANSVDFFESTGAVTDVTVAGPNDITVALGMSGEGNDWTMKMRMTLSADGKTLTTDAGTKQIVARVRCPAK